MQTWLSSDSLDGLLWKSIHSYCYDSLDEIVEHLFKKMVWESFAWNYGIKVSMKDTNRYAFEIDRNSNHIECKLINLFENV